VALAASRYRCKEKNMAYDFDRPFVDSKQLPNYVATDIEEARLYGGTVRAAEMSNAEYSARFRKLSADLTMKPPPSHGRIFPGYLVVRKIDTKAEYETWMPDHVFEEIYVASSPAAE
jgi:hypothetical protein